MDRRNFFKAGLAAGAAVAATSVLGTSCAPAVPGRNIKAKRVIIFTFDGIRVRNKDLNLSFLGAGGLQLNLTKNLGLYVEPQVSWTIPIRTQGLETYRSEHPFMFSVGTGLRITFGK